MTERNCLHIDASDNAINAIVLDDAFPFPDFLTKNGEKLVVDYNGPWAPGAHYNGTTVEMPPESDPPPRIVTRVTSAQAKLALYNAGHLDDVAAAVASYPPMKIFFDNSPYWDIGHPYVRGLASEIGLDDETVSALFASAAAL